MPSADQSFLQGSGAVAGALPAGGTNPLDRIEPMPVLDLTAGSVDLTRAICDIPSESGDETVLADAISADGKVVYPLAPTVEDATVAGVVVADPSLR